MWPWAHDPWAFTAESNGAADAYRPVILDEEGKLDTSLLPQYGGGSIVYLKQPGFTIEDSETYDFPTKPFGFLLVGNGTSGYGWMGFFRGGGNQVQEIWNGSSSIFTTTKDTASRINIYYDATDGRYEIQNLRGAVNSFYVTLLGA